MILMALEDEEDEGDKAGLGHLVPRICFPCCFLVVPIVVLVLQLRSLLTTS